MSLVKNSETKHLNPFSLHSNRCVPTIATHSSTSTICSFPESKGREGDPTYISPYSSNCLARTTITTQSTETLTSSNEVASSVTSILAVLGRWLSDVLAAYPIILIASILSLLGGFLFSVRTFNIEMRNEIKFISRQLFDIQQNQPFGALYSSAGCCSFSSPSSFFIKPESFT